MTGTRGAMEKGVVTVADVADLIGRSKGSARRLLNTLEAMGLRRKGGGRWAMARRGRQGRIQCSEQLGGIRHDG